MKKLVLCTIAVVLCAGMAYAAMPTEKDYENLDTLRVKVVRMKREIDKFVRDIMATYPADEATDAFGQDIRVDITETGKDVVIRADLPGMAKDKIEITMESSHVLRIAGTRDIAKKKAAPGVVRQERMQGRFERVLELPVECKSEGINATYQDGVLEIIIPKMGQVQAKPVKIGIK